MIVEWMMQHLQCLDPWTNNRNQLYEINFTTLQNKLAALYRHLNVAYDLDLVDTNQFKLGKKITKVIKTISTGLIF